MAYSTGFGGLGASVPQQYGGLTDNQFVISLYHDLLGRDPAASEVSFWVNGLQSGFSRDDVYNGFLTSGEYFAKQQQQQQQAAAIPAPVPAVSLPVSLPSLPWWAWVAGAGALLLVFRGHE